MPVSRGKDFEQIIRKAFEAVPDTSVYRLQDSMGGYSGVANICDFIIYRFPYQFFIECKSHYGNTLPLTCITENQMQGMYEMSKISGVHAGVIVWFIDKDVTYYKDIRKVVALKEMGAKSLRFDDPDVIQITGTKKRVFFDYKMADFFSICAPAKLF